MSTPTSYINKQRYIPPAIKVKEIKFGRLLAGSPGGQGTNIPGGQGEGEGSTVDPFAPPSTSKQSSLISYPFDFEANDDY